MRAYRLAVLTAIVLYTLSAQPPAATDLEGRSVRLPAKGTAVLVFTRTDCPIANRYAPELARLHAKFSGRDVAFWLAYVDPSPDVGVIRTHIREYKYPFPALLDSQRALVRETGVRVTPEAAVFRDGRLIYRGRIDDRFVELGKTRPAATTHDLEDVLELVTSGKPVKFRTTTATGCAIETSVAPTFTKDIAPVVYANCTPCHRPGEAAPFSLITYEDVRAHAKQIVAITAKRLMPPWKPEPGKGTFEGERRLSDAQIRLFSDWLAATAPRGDPAELPAPPDFSDGGQLGKPDLILKLDRPYQLAATGPDVFRNFVLKLPLDRTRFARAVEIGPGNKKVVHHANLLIDRSRSSRLRDGRDGAPGFPGMDTRIETRSFDPESHFLFWKPGTPVVQEPEGMSLPLDPGTDLVLNMHLQPSGKPETILPSVAIYFTDKAPTKRPMLIQLERDGAIDVPAGKKEFVVSDTLKLPVDVDVLGIYPHAHYLGKDIQAVATLPDGSQRWLIHIPDWDINWQAVYRYRKPVSLPRGTVISARFTYDNSADNPRNPHHPPQRVVNGDRSEDEMAHLWLQVLPRHLANGPDPRITLQKAVLQRRLQKYPSDFYAEFSLGAISQSEQQPAEAVQRYRKALALNPKDAAAHNALGTALLEMGQDSQAMAEFRTAIRFEPAAADAHYNLARVLLQANQIPEAIQHLRESVRIDPQDAAAMSDLGAALCMSGQAQEGLALLRRAVDLQPHYFIGRYNLGQALAGLGRSAEAEQQLREALRLKPGDQDTLAALKQLRTR